MYTLKCNGRKGENHIAYGERRGSYSQAYDFQADHCSLRSGPEEDHVSLWNKKHSLCHDGSAGLREHHHTVVSRTSPEMTKEEEL